MTLVVDLPMTCVTATIYGGVEVGWVVTVIKAGLAHPLQAMSPAAAQLIQRHICASIEMFAGH